MAALRSHPLRTRLLLGALLLAAAVLLVVAPVFVLAMAQAIALFAMVAGRCMPGEDLIVRLRGVRTARRRRRPAAQRAYGVVLVHRTGRLIAAALAMRPPPARPLATTH
jgi:hypothetical protein